MKKRILLTIEYKGGAYSGWQIQRGKISVQQVLTEALEKVCLHKIKLYGSGRTDSAVHAIAQQAHFDCDNNSIPDDKFARCLNLLLPSDIRVKESKRVDGGFHARFDAKKKIYLYKMYSGNTPSPLREGLFAYVPYQLDINAVKEGCNFLTGKHDFSAFCASGSNVKDCVREIFYADVREKLQDGYREIYFEICGNGFLRNMVRIIAGTLIEIGRGKLKAEDMKAIIDGGARSRAGFTAQACGLYLKEVIY